MTRYSRSVIPGRASETLDTAIDNLVFGEKGDKANAPDAEEGEPLADAEAISFVERAATDRRRGAKRRGSDFTPLPGEAAARRAAEGGGSRRGPLLLAGALVVVAVFGVVVFNAYRDGVRPEDSAIAPKLADAGAFKTKPAEPVAAKPTITRAADATVFDQVESKPVAPAPEVREPEAAPAPLSATTQLAEAEPAPAKPAPAKPAPTSSRTALAAAKPGGPPPVVKAPAAAPTPKPVQTAAATTQATPVKLAGGYSPSFAAGGNYVVQIAAPSTPEGAAAEWKKSARKAPALFEGAEKIVVQADVNGRTVYRLRAGSFATGAEADAFCNAFKSAGGQCYRATK